MIEACTNQGVATCEKATAVLLDMLDGKRGDACDLVANLYEKDMRYQKYRGLKNQFMSAVTYVFTLSSLGMGLHGAVLSFGTGQASQWQVAQASLALRHRTALYRI